MDNAVTPIVEFVAYVWKSVKTIINVVLNLTTNDIVNLIINTNITLSQGNANPPSPPGPFTDNNANDEPPTPPEFSTDDKVAEIYPSYTPVNIITT